MSSSSTSNDANNEENGNQEERRELRREYRELKDLIHSSHTLSSIPSTEYQEYHEAINQLFGHVENIRELGIDADALADLAKAVKGQASKLGDISSAFNFQTFARNLVAKYTTPENTHFDWSQYGEDVGCIFALVPQWDCMHGTMTKEIKERKKPEARKPKEHLVTEHLEELSNNKKDGDKEESEVEATNGRSQTLVNVIKPTGAHDKKKLIPMMDLLIDTSDPVQTIENFFDFSFLIKNKEAKVVEVDGVLHIQSTELESKENNNNQSSSASSSNSSSSTTAIVTEPSKKQMVIRIDMKDLLKLCVDYQPKPSSSSATDEDNDDDTVNAAAGKRRSSSSSSNVSARRSSASVMRSKRRASLTPLHREDELYTAANAHEQADIIQRRAQQLTAAATSSTRKAKK